MLQQLNERIKGVISWIVIGLITLTFTLFGLDYYFQSRQVSDSAIEVNGTAISKQQLQMAMHHARQLAHDDAQQSSNNEIKSQIIEDLIVKEVMLQTARINGFEVSDEQVDTTILSIPQFQEDGQFSEKRYEQLLTSNQYTFSSFKNEVQQGILLNQQRFALAGSAFALSNEINNFIQLFFQTRDYRFAEFKPEEFIHSEQISLESAQNYYQRYKERYRSPEKISIHYVTLSLDDIKNQIKIEEPAVKQYYDDNKQSFTKPASWQIKELIFSLPENASKQDSEESLAKAEKTYEELQSNPEKFDTLQKTNNEVRKKTIGELKDVAEVTQDVRWVSAEDDVLAPVLLPLNKTGEFSKPIKVKDGYAIYKIMAFNPQRLQTYEEVQKQIKSQLSQEQLQTKYAQALETLSDLSFQSPDTLEPVSQTLNLKINFSLPFSKNKTNNQDNKKSPLIENEKIIEAAFSDDVLNGNNSEVIQLAENTVVVLRLKEHFPAKQLSFEEVKPLVIQKLIQKKAAESLNSLVQQLNKENIASENQKRFPIEPLKWQEKKNASRNSKGLTYLVNEIAFELTEQNPCRFQFKKPSFFLVCLDNIKEGSLESLDKERQFSLASQLESSYGMMDYDLYVKYLIAQSKIVKQF